MSYDCIILAGLTIYNFVGLCYSNFYICPLNCAGWAFYLAMGSTLVTFVCSVLSVQAEVSTSSDKVQDEILEGKNLICLL